uniref:Hydrolase_4 domain-containing protein n=1 Tax=Parastrongyloides trichosuri TaxID=131310 RepID=A0A0N4Z970_PARTI
MKPQLSSKSLLIESDQDVNLVDDLKQNLHYKSGKISSHHKTMITLNLNANMKKCQNKCHKTTLTKPPDENEEEYPTLIIAVENQNQNEFILPLNSENEVTKEYKFLRKNNKDENIVQMVEEPSKKRHISKDLDDEESDGKLNYFNYIFSFYENVKCFVTSAARLLYVITPPTRKSIVRKAAFHPPKRGKNYFLTNNSEHNNIIFKSAEEAHGYKNVILCLPTLVDRKYIAVDLFQQLLRTKVKIIETRLNTKIVTLLCKCLHSYRTNRKSPYLIILSQPNSSDIGSGMLTDPNFVDIADYLNLDVLVYDYSGFGLSQSKPGEKELFANIDAVYEYAVNGLKYQPKDIILLGFSIGTAVSVYLASRIKDIAGVILLAPFTSLLRVLFHKPKEVKTNIIDQFVTVDRIQKIKSKTLIIHGTNDSMVSIKHSIILFSKLKNPSKPLWLQGATHQSIYSEKSTWKRVKTFCRCELGTKDKWKTAACIKRRRSLPSILTTTYNNSILELSVSTFPSEMLEFRKQLTPHELNILHKIESETKLYKNIDELTSEIKKQSPSFETKLIELIKALQKRINALSVKSLEFVYEEGGKVQHLFDLKGKSLNTHISDNLKNEYIMKYEALSSETKENLKNVLPMYEMLYKTMKKNVLK